MDFKFTDNVWAQGTRPDSFLSKLVEHREIFSERHDSVALTEVEITRLARIQKPLKLAVLTEEWCKDCQMNIPILMRMAQTNPNLDLRLFTRKDWIGFKKYLADQGILSIPTLVILEEAYKQLGVWVERPKAVAEAVDRWHEAHPEVEEMRHRFDIDAAEKQAKLHAFSDELTAEMRQWYDAGLQSETVREVTELLETAATS